MKKIACLLLFVILYSLYNYSYADVEFMVFPEHNYKFKPPAGWVADKPLEGGCSLVLINSPKDKDFPLFISVRAAVCPINNLDEYAATLIPANKKGLVERMVQVNEVKEAVTLLGGCPAKDILYIGEGAVDVKTKSATTKEALILFVGMENVPVLYKNVFTIKDGIIYMLEYGGHDEEFKKHENEFNDLIKSFVINKEVRAQAEESLRKFQELMNSHKLPYNTKGQHK